MLLATEGWRADPVDSLLRHESACCFIFRARVSRSLFSKVVVVRVIAILDVLLTNPPEGDRSGGGAELGLGGVKEKLAEKSRRK